MRSAVSARTRYLMATALVTGLIGGLLATTIDSAPAAGAAPLAPNFFTFSGSPFDDGLNHYLVGLDGAATVAGDELLRLANDGNLEFGGAGIVSSVTADELAAIIAGGSGLDVNAAGVVAAHPEISSLRPLGFDLYAAAGTIGLDEIRELPGVALAEFDSRLATASADPLYPSQWSLENDGATAEPWEVSADADIDAPEGWHRTRGAGVIVAVIDSGVDISHPDLDANVWHNTAEVCDNGADDDANGYIDDCVGWDFVNNDNTPEDTNGHGTHVAGIIAAEANNRIGIAGVAYESQVMALKIGDGSPPLSAAIEAFAYAIDNGARIINASWVSDDPAAATFLKPAMDAAKGAGVLVVTGAGNFGTDIDRDPLYPASMTHNNLLVVGASTPQDAPAGYSGYGKRSVDLFAPGEHIVSTLPGGNYGVYSGTSMAAPMVSGAAALLWAARPDANYQQITKSIVEGTDGRKEGITSFQNLAGSGGRLNLNRSVFDQHFQPSLMYAFRDFNSFEPDELHNVSVVAEAVDPWILPPQIPYRYRLGLYVPYEGQPMAVVGYPVTHVYGGSSSDWVTDGTGRATLGPVFERQQRSAFVQDGDVTELRMTLPAGTYAITMEIVDVSDAADPVTMGDANAVFFVVGIDGSITQMPDNSIGATTPTTTSAPVATTSDPSSGSTTTAAPTSSTTTSTTSVVPEGPDSSTTTTTTTGPEDPEDPTGSSTTTTTTEPPTTVLPSTTTTSTTTTTTTETPTTSTTEPGTTESTTTTTTTTSTAPTTTVVDPNAIRITEVQPNEGPTAGGTLVTITGKNFPDLPLVDFGDTRGGSIVTSTDKFIVLPSPRGTAGYVDVTVTDRATEGVATYPDGFLYTDDEPGSVTTTTSVTVTSGPPSSTTSSAPSPPSSTNPPSNGGSIDDWLGAVLVTPEGLTLAPPSPNDPINGFPVELWAGTLCNEPVCPGWVLEN